MPSYYAVPRFTIALFLVAAAGCGGGTETRTSANGAAEPSGQDAAQLLRAFDEIDRRMAGADSLFQPLPLIGAAAENALRRYGSARQLERARVLGIGRSPSQAEIQERTANGGLVALNDGEFWVVRNMEYSSPLVVAGLHASLEGLGREFQARLAAIGAPAFRFEISSALRSSEDQRRLRAVNPNAASGESTHEYGVSVDIPYSAFAAPAESAAATPTPELAIVLDRYERAASERTAARRALELKALFAEVLVEAQEEGELMVTLERQQPVFHVTLSR